MNKILQLDAIIIDNRLNPREGALDQDVILDYAAHVDDLPPMHVFEVDIESPGSFYFLVSGFHRIAAHRLAGRTSAHFIVHVGTMEEAREFADLDNLKHGLRLSREERRAVIERQLRRHPDWSDARIATACYTTDKTVRVVRERLEASSEIPRFDVLTGADGISRPRTISRPAASEAQPDDRQVTLESVAVAPALLVPVEVLEERAVERDAFGVPYNNPTALTDAIMDLPDEEKDLAINDPVVYRAMELEQIEAGLAEAEPMPSWLRDDDAGEDIPDETEEETNDDTSEESAQAVPGQPEIPVRPVEPAAPAVPPPPPVPATTAAPLPPPPVVRDAAWIVSISWRPGAPALITILHGATPEQWLPAEAAEICAALQARLKPEAGPVVVSDGDGREWLEA